MSKSKKQRLNADADKKLLLNNIQQIREVVKNDKPDGNSTSLTTK